MAIASWNLVRRLVAVPLRLMGFVLFILGILSIDLADDIRGHQ